MAETPCSQSRGTHVQSLGWGDPLEEENGNPLQYSCLKNFMDKRSLGATVYDKESDTTEQLNTQTHTDTHTHTHTHTLYIK